MSDFRIGDTVEWTVDKMWGDGDQFTNGGVVVPTSPKVPDGEINVMDLGGSVFTIDKSRLTLKYRWEA